MTIDELESRTKAPATLIGEVGDHDDNTDTLRTP